MSEDAGHGLSSLVAGVGARGHAGEVASGFCNTSESYGILFYLFICERKWYSRSDKIW